jgi:hypothetical protein
MLLLVVVEVEECREVTQTSREVTNNESIVFYEEEKAGFAK